MPYKKADGIGTGTERLSRNSTKTPDISQQKGGFGEANQRT